MGCRYPDSAIKEGAKRPATFTAPHANAPAQRNEAGSVAWLVCHRTSTRKEGI